jgi:hypothetical protein
VGRRRIRGDAAPDQAHLVTILRSDAFRFPTSVAVHDEWPLVVNGQLDKLGGSPELPFTVVAVEKADG